MKVKLFPKLQKRPLFKLKKFEGKNRMEYLLEKVTPWQAGVSDQEVAF